MKSSAVVTAICAAGLLLVQAAQAQLIMDGSFEAVGGYPTAPASFTTQTAGTFDRGGTTGWQQLAGTNFYGGANVNGHILGTNFQAAHGTQSRHLGAGDGAGAIAQTFATATGKEYQLRFFSSGFPGGGSPQTGHVSVGTLNTDYTTPQGTNTLTDMGWTQQIYNFTATAPTSTVRFDTPGASPAGSITIDNVRAYAVGHIHNGSFEINGGNNTVPSGWAPITNQYGAWNGAGTILTAQEGSFVMHPGASFGNGGMFQDVITKAGQQYELSFYAVGFPAPSGGAQNQNGLIQIGTPGANDTSLATNNVAQLVNSQFTVPDFVTSADWTRFTYSFIGLGDITRISFQNLGGTGNAINLDNVQLLATPEPASIACWTLLGLGAIGLAVRTRRRSQQGK